MSFKITVKTVGNVKFQLEANNFTTCADIQDAIVSEAPEEFLKGGTIKKLLFKGKTLKPEHTVGELQIGENDEIVCLAKRTRKSKSKSTSPAKSEEKENDAKPTGQYTPREEDVKQLMLMGFPHHSVIVSLHAAQGDAALAAQYLIAGGIPADRAMALHKSGVLNQYSQQAPTKAPVGANGMPAQFEALLSNKDALTEVMGNEQVQQQCIGMLQEENPELFKRFIADPDRVGATDEFAKAIFSIMKKSYQPRKRKTITLTKEDRDNLAILEKECHLNRQQACQAYFKFHKDVEKAKAFCLDLLAKATAAAESRHHSQSPAPVRAPLSPIGANANRRAFGNKDEDKPSTVRMVEREPSAEFEESKECENETILTITPDMLFGDDEQ